MKGNVDGEEAKARLKARKRMIDCFSDTRNKRQLEQINFTHFTFANRTCTAPERRHNHKGWQIFHVSNFDKGFGSHEKRIIS